MVSLSLKDIERGIGADLFRRPIITAVFNAFMLRLYYDTILVLPDSEPTQADRDDYERKSRFLNLDPPEPGSYDAEQLKKKAANHALIEHVAASAIFIFGHVSRLVGFAETIMWIALAIMFRLSGLPKIYAFEKLLLDLRISILPQSVRYIDRNVKLTSHPLAPLPKLVASRRGVPFMPLTIITAAETLTRETEDLLRLLRYINQMTIAYWTEDSVVLVGRNEELVQALCELHKKPVHVDLGWHIDVIENTALKLSITFIRNHFPPSQGSVPTIHHTTHNTSQSHNHHHVKPAAKSISESSRTVMPRPEGTEANVDEDVDEIVPENMSDSNSTAASSNANSVAVDFRQESNISPESNPVAHVQPSDALAGIPSISLAPSSDGSSSYGRHRTRYLEKLQKKSPVCAVSRRIVKVQLEMEATQRNVELLLISLDQFATICESPEPGKRHFNGKRFAIFAVGIFISLILILYYQNMKIDRPEIDLLTLAFAVYTIWMTVGKSAAFGEVEEETPLNTVTRENILMAFHGLVLIPKNVINICWIPEVYRRDRAESNDGNEKNNDDDSGSSSDSENSESSMVSSSVSKKMMPYVVSDVEVVDGSISLFEAAIYLNIYYHYGHLIKWKGPRLLLDRYDFSEEEGDNEGVGHIVAVDRVSRLGQLRYVGESRTLLRLGGGGRKKGCRHLGQVLRRVRRPCWIIGKL